MKTQGFDARGVPCAPLGPHKGGTTMSQPCIVVADDDLALLRTLVTVLEETGAAVTPVQDGAELIQRMANDQPLDLIIADIAMPWMTGLQVARAARDARIQIPIIIMTALEVDDLERQVASLGRLTMLLRKPFHLDELRRAVRSLLSAPAA